VLPKMNSAPGNSGLRASRISTDMHPAPQLSVATVWPMLIKISVHLELFSTKFTGFTLPRCVPG
jgi:hypothetical protein